MLSSYVEDIVSGSIIMKATDVGEHTYVAGNRLRSGPYLPDSFYDGNYHTIGFLWSKDTYSVWYDGVFSYEYQNVPPTDCPAFMP